MNKIGLVVAMAEETEHILKKLGKEKDKLELHGYNVRIYNIYDKDVYLINSGIGEINAAASTMLLISKFNVDVIINYGLSGGLKSNIKVGDLLIAKDIIHTDFDISAFTRCKKGQYNDVETVELACNERLIELVDKIYPNKLKKIRLASADKFIADTSVKESLIKDYDADICEMESAGIIRVANKANVPTLFIKTISDSADEKAQDDFEVVINKGITAYSNLIEQIIINI